MVVPRVFRLAASPPDALVVHGEKDCLVDR